MISFLFLLIAREEPGLQCVLVSQGDVEQRRYTLSYPYLLIYSFILPTYNRKNTIVYLNEVVQLRTDSCDERRVYKSEDISGPKGDTYMFNTSPKSLDFCLSKDA